MAEKELCFPSGLRVHLIERPDSRVAALSMVVDGGHAAEQSEERGAAHLVEHLWFRARPGGGATVNDRGAGLDFDATTRSDVTAYTTVGSASDLAALLELEAARLRNPLVGVDAEAMTAEVRIIQDELLYRGEHGTRMAQARLDALLFPKNHPYHQTVATRQSMASLTLEQIEGYASRTYVPENTTLHVEADQAIAAMQTSVESAFGELLSGEGSECQHFRNQAEPPKPPGGGSMVSVDAPLWSQRIMMSWSLPAAYGPDDFTLRMAGRQLESAIWRRLPWVGGLKADMSGVGAGCSTTPGRLASRVTCMVELPDDVDAGELVNAVMASLTSHWGISADDQYRRASLARSMKATTLDRTLRNADRLDARYAQERALRRHVVGPGDPLGGEIMSTLSLDPNRLGAVAQAYLTPQRAVVLLMRPKPIDGDQAAVTEFPVRMEVDEIPAWTPARPELAPTVRTLENGLRMVHSNRGSAPVTRTAVIRPGGSLIAPLGVDRAWDVIGAYDVPGVSLREMRSKTGAGAWEETGWDVSTIHARAGGGSADLAMWSTRVWLDSTVVDTKSMQANLDRVLEGVERDLQAWPTMQTYALRMEHLVGEDPSAVPWWNEYALARRAREGQILKWRKTLDNPQRSTLLVVSPDLADANEKADKYLRKWKGKDTELPAIPPEPALPTSSRLMALEWPSLVTEVRMSCRLPAMTLDNEAAHDVLESVLERGAWQTLREDGGTYSPSVFISTPRHGVALLNLHATVNPMQTVQTVQAFRGLVAAVEKGPSETLVQWGKLEVLGAHTRQHASTLSHFHALEFAIDRGFPIESVGDYPDRVDAVDGAALSALVESCTGADAITVVGPRSNEILQEGGLEPVPIDWVREGQRRAEEVK